MPGWVEQAAGGLLTGLVLLDVFLTVLYARMGTSLLAGPLARLTWRAFRTVSYPLGRRRGWALSFCGPAVLVAIVAAWAGGLILGSALVIHPALGAGIKGGPDDAPADFAAALDAAGTSLSVVGTGEFTPRTTAYRLLYLFNSVVGVSVLSLTITYFLQVYGALRERTVLGLKLHLASGETGDASEWLAALGPGGDFGPGVPLLAEAGAEVAAVAEAHHFYPVLFHFRFPDPAYATARVALLCLDAAALIRTALAPDRYARLAASAEVRQLERAAGRLAEYLARVYVGSRPGGDGAAARERWRERYRAAVAQLRAAGIETAADEAGGAEAYVALREQWDWRLSALAPAAGYAPAEIDPAGQRRVNDQTA